MTGDAQGLAPAAQETLKSWHRFVETRDESVLRPLFADSTVFRSPFVHLPIPGRPAYPEPDLRVCFNRITRERRWSEIE